MNRSIKIKSNSSNTSFLTEKEEMALVTRSKIIATFSFTTACLFLNTSVTASTQPVLLQSQRLSETSLNALLEEQPHLISQLYEVKNKNKSLTYLRSNQDWISKLFDLHYEIMSRFGGSKPSLEVFSDREVDHWKTMLVTIPETRDNSNQLLTELIKTWLFKQSKELKKSLIIKLK